MSEEEIFDKTKGAYLCLIHPKMPDCTYQREIASVVELAPAAPDELVAAMITGASWRERLLGLCMAMAKRTGTFSEPMLQSLRDPRGISIVPTCAALAVLVKQGKYAMEASFPEKFDRQVFDGEISWAANKALHFVGLRAEDVPGRGPNYGQIFDDHIQVYSWLYAR